MEKGLLCFYHGLPEILGPDGLGMGLILYSNTTGYKSYLLVNTDAHIAILYVWLMILGD